MTLRKHLFEFKCKDCEYEEKFVTDASDALALKKVHSEETGHRTERLRSVPFKIEDVPQKEPDPWTI